MSKINISFNGAKYSIDASSLSSATNTLKSHFSTVMNGSGAVIDFGGTSYNIDSTKLDAAASSLVSYFGTIAGDGSTVVINGVEYNIDPTKVTGAIAGFEDVLGDLSSCTITWLDSDGVTVLNTEQVAYGAVPSYEPTKDGYFFDGWSPVPAAATGDVSYTATWAGMLDFASLSWNEINSYVRQGKANRFELGARKTIRASNGLNWDVTIVGINHDDLANGSGKAGLTCEVTNTSKVLNYWGADDTGPWHESYAYSGSWASNLPSDFTSVLKTVRKTYYDLETSSLQTVDVKHFLPAACELKLNAGRIDEGTIYEYFTDGLVGKCTLPIWTRTRPQSNYAYYANSSGNIMSTKDGDCVAKQVSFACI